MHIFFIVMFPFFGHVLPSGQSESLSHGTKSSKSENKTRYYRKSDAQIKRELIIKSREA